MSTKNTHFALTVLTGTQEAELLDCLRRMHSIVWNRTPEGKQNLPTTFSDLTAEQLDYVSNRAILSLEAAEQHRTEAKVGKYRDGAARVVMTALTAAKADKVAYDALPASLRARLGTFDDTVVIPLTSFAGVFEEGTPLETVAKVLRGLGYTQGKGNHGKDAPMAVRVSLEKGK